MVSEVITISCGAALEGHRGCEQPVSGFPPGEDAAELEGVDLEGFAVGARRPRTPDGTGEVQPERLSVAPRPLACHVGYQFAVVVGGQAQRSADGPAEIHTMHPDIAGEDHVGDEPDGPPFADSSDRLRFGHSVSANDRGCAPASLRCAAADGVELLGDLRWGQRGALSDLEVGELIDELTSAVGCEGLVREPLLPAALADRRCIRRHAEDVARKLSHIPCGAIGLTRPLLGSQRGTGAWAGQTVTVWVDKDGNYMAAPNTATDNALGAIGAALGFLMLGTVGCGLLLLGVHWLLDKHHRSQWQREWQGLGHAPGWSVN